MEHRSVLLNDFAKHMMLLLAAVSAFASPVIVSRGSTFALVVFMGSLFVGLTSYLAGASAMRHILNQRIAEGAGSRGGAAGRLPDVVTTNLNVQYSLGMVALVGMFVAVVLAAWFPAERNDLKMEISSLAISEIPEVQLSGGAIEISNLEASSSDAKPIESAGGVAAFAANGDAANRLGAFLGSKEPLCENEVGPVAGAAIQLLFPLVAQVYDFSGGGVDVAKAAIEEFVGRLARSADEESVRAFAELVRRLLGNGSETVVGGFPVVRFEIGEEAVPRAGRSVIRKFAYSEAALGDSIFVVAGFTDASGSETANSALSRARADAVARLLVSNGLPSWRVVSFGLGVRQIRATDFRERREPEDRRVEIRVVRIADWPSSS